MLRVYLLWSLVLLTLFAQAQNDQYDREGGQSSENLEKALPDTAVFIYKAYTIDDNNHKVYHLFDTALWFFQRYTPLQRQSPSWTSKSYYGQAVEPNLFIYRKPLTDFIFWTPYSYMWPGLENELYYEINKPFTELYLSKANKTAGNEQRVGVRHSRNFSPTTNGGLEYHVISTPGLDGHNNRTRHARFTLFASHQRVRYSMHSRLHIDKSELGENGGYKDGNFYFNPDSIQPNLLNAKTLIKRNEFLVDQQYLIGPLDSIKGPLGRPSANAKASVRLRSRYESMLRRYTDDLSYTEDEGGNKIVDYYPTIYFDSIATYDSVHYRRIVNTLDFEAKEGFIPKVNVGLIAGLSHEKAWFYNFRDYIHPENNKFDYYNLLFRGKVFNRVSDYWNWNAGVQYYFMGGRTGDIDLSFDLKRYIFHTSDSSIIRFQARYLNFSLPSLWRHYYSNHISWNNTYEQETRLNLSLTLDMPAWGVDAGVHTSTMQNYVYFGQSGSPEQYLATFQLTTAYLRKNLRLGGFGFDAEFYWQHLSDQTALRLPEWVGRISLLYDYRMPNGAMRLQIGTDISITSRFKAAQFNPVTGQFQLQDEVEIGNYPLIDGFINIHVRKARVFFKFSNIYQQIVKEWYMPSAYSPADNSLFRFGVIWYFEN